MVLSIYMKFCNRQIELVEKITNKKIGVPVGGLGIDWEWSWRNILG